MAPIKHSTESDPPDPAERQPLLAVSQSSPSGRGRSGPADEIAIEVQPPDAGQMEGGASHSSHSKGSAREKGELRTCRICFETEESPEDADPANPLISPCLCSGSSRFVHRACLAQWRASNHRQDAHWQCEVCHFRYLYARAWWGSVLGSQVTLGCVFLVLLSTFIFSLGFIPVLGSGAKETYGPVLAHLGNGIVGLGIMGIVLSLVLGIARACGAATLLWMPDPWCPTALCLDCQGGGLPLCVDCMGAGECGMALAAFLAVLIVVLGVVASAMLTWSMLLMVTQLVLGKAQRMVENIGEEPPKAPTPDIKPNPHIVQGDDSPGSTSASRRCVARRCSDSGQGSAVG